MKSLLLGLLVLGSFSTFAQDSECVGVAKADIMQTPVVKTKVQNLLSDLTTIDENGNIVIDQAVKAQIEDISDNAYVLAESVCN